MIGIISGSFADFNTLSTRRQSQNSIAEPNIEEIGGRGRSFMTVWDKIILNMSCFKHSEPRMISWAKMFAKRHWNKWFQETISLLKCNYLCWHWIQERRHQWSRVTARERNTRILLYKCVNSSQKELWLQYHSKQNKQFTTFYYNSTF